MALQKEVVQGKARSGQVGWMWDVVLSVGVSPDGAHQLACTLCGGFLCFLPSLQPFCLLFLLLLKPGVVGNIEA